MVEFLEHVGDATDCSVGGAASIGFDLRPVDTFPPSGQQPALQNAKSHDSKEEHFFKGGFGIFKSGI
ncbi:hypothetical protein TNCT_574731 [Trichonephila clavata]|uniref:Uncharacterized protein n=1 Tax=Trichonephila clavata TaxID=2740835 RepID=A0A8X6FFN0_TRICU|nr:hypothetical protein TNCT_574731 [Trichonephila clavata]